MNIRNFHVFLRYINALLLMCSVNFCHQQDSNSKKEALVT